jgi:hypothetical protein
MVMMGSNGEGSGNAGQACFECITPGQGTSSKWANLSIRPAHTDETTNAF